MALQAGTERSVRRLTAGNAANGVGDLSLGVVGVEVEVCGHGVRVDEGSHSHSLGLVQFLDDTSDEIEAETEVGVDDTSRAVEDKGDVHFRFAA